MDRRIFRRIPATLPLRFGLFERHAPTGLSEELGTGTSTNLSTNGICFCSDTAIEVGRLVALELTLPPPDNTVICHGRAVWCEEDRTVGYRIGVELWWSGGDDQVAQTCIHSLVHEESAEETADAALDRRAGLEGRRVEDLSPSASGPLNGSIDNNLEHSASPGEPGMPWNRIIRKVGRHIEDRVSHRRALRMLPLGPVGVRDWNLMRENDPDIGRLRGISLIRLDLAGVDFRDVDLHDAHLTHSDLSFAHLENADLHSADLLAARLISAGAVGAKMPRCDLRDAEMSFGYFNRADLREANLERANLSRATLECADLRGAHLARAELTDTVLTGARFDHADLRDADLRGAEVDGTSFRGANLHGADLREVDLANADLADVDLTGVRVDPQ